MLAKATFMWAEDLKRDAAEGRPADEESGGTEGGGPSTEGGGPSTEG
jgi:hypothetical protein